MEEIEDDRRAIEEDIKEEQALEKDLDELEEQARRLEEEHLRRMAALKGEPPPPQKARLRDPLTPVASGSFPGWPSA